MYSTKSETTREVCEQLGYVFEIGFIKTMERDGKIYVSGTIGKPHEWQQLKTDCENAGYIYKGGN